MSYFIYKKSPSEIVNNAMESFNKLQQKRQKKKKIQALL